jgi:hypothetical protein
MRKYGKLKLIIGQEGLLDLRNLWFELQTLKYGKKAFIRKSFEKLLSHFLLKFVGVKIGGTMGRLKVFWVG